LEEAFSPDVDYEEQQTLEVAGNHLEGPADETLSLDVADLWEATHDDHHLASSFSS